MNGLMIINAVSGDCNNLVAGTSCSYTCKTGYSNMSGPDTLTYVCVGNIVFGNPLICAGKIEHFLFSIGISQITLLLRQC